jgi:hypothetical protein
MRHMPALPQSQQAWPAAAMAWSLLWGWTRGRGPSPNIIPLAFGFLACLEAGVPFAVTRLRPKQAPARVAWGAARCVPPPSSTLSVRARQRNMLAARPST